MSDHNHKKKNSTTPSLHAASESYENHPQPTVYRAYPSESSKNADMHTISTEDEFDKFTTKPQGPQQSSSRHVSCSHLQMLQVGWRWWVIRVWALGDWVMGMWAMISVSFLFFCVIIWCWWCFFRCSEVDKFTVILSGQLSKLRPAYVCKASWRNGNTPSCLPLSKLPPPTCTAWAWSWRTPTVVNMMCIAAAHLHKSWVQLNLTRASPRIALAHHSILALLWTSFGGYDDEYAPDSPHCSKSVWVSAVDANVNGNFESPVSVPICPAIASALTSAPVSVFRFSGERMIHTQTGLLVGQPSLEEGCLTRWLHTCCFSLLLLSFSITQFCVCEQINPLLSFPALLCQHMGGCSRSSTSTFKFDDDEHAAQQWACVWGDWAPKVPFELWKALHLHWVQSQ